MKVRLEVTDEAGNVFAAEAEHEMRVAGRVDVDGKRVR